MVVKISMQETMVLYLTLGGMVLIRSDDPVIGKKGVYEIFLGSDYNCTKDHLLPKAGDRLKYYSMDEQTEEVFTLMSDWVVERVEELKREDPKEDKIAIAWCTHDPIK